MFTAQTLHTSIFIRIIGICASVYGMAMNWEGLFSLTYFTNLSNIFISLILALDIVWDLARFAHVGKNGIAQEHSPLHEKPTWWYVTKFIATLAITVTFTLYLCFLAPTNKLGFFGAYANHGYASFCVHFLMPLIAIIHFLWYDTGYKSAPSHVFLCVVPPFVYIGFVYILSFVFGVRWDGMAAPYNFLNYAAPSGWFGLKLGEISSTSLGIGVVYFILVFTAIFLGIGYAFLRIKERLHGTQNHSA